MKKAELLTLVGREVEVILNDGERIKGILNYVTDFSDKFEYRKPDYFYVIGSTWNFKVSHVRKITPL